MYNKGEKQNISLKLFEKTLQIDVDITRFDNFYRIVLKLITIIINIVIRNITCCDNESVQNQRSKGEMQKRAEQTGTYKEN